MSYPVSMQEHSITLLVRMNKTLASSGQTWRFNLAQNHTIEGVTSILIRSAAFQGVDTGAPWVPFVGLRIETNSGFHKDCLVGTQTSLAQPLETLRVVPLLMDKTATFVRQYETPVEVPVGIPSLRTLQLGLSHLYDSSLACPLTDLQLLLEIRYTGNKKVRDFSALLDREALA